MSSSTIRCRSDAEVADVTVFLQTYSARVKAPDARLAAWQSYCQMLFCTNEFIYIE